MTSLHWAALSIGIVTGFLLWLPSILRHYGSPRGDMMLWAGIANAAAFGWICLIGTVAYSGWGKQPDAQFAILRHAVPIAYFLTGFWAAATLAAFLAARRVRQDDD